jgi:hypothetical protein
VTILEILSLSLDYSMLFYTKNFTSIAVPFLMYVEGGFMNNIGLTGVVFPNSAMWSLQVKVAVYETMSWLNLRGNYFGYPLFSLWSYPQKMCKITIHTYTC